MSKHPIGASTHRRERTSEAGAHNNCNISADCANIVSIISFKILPCCILLFINLLHKTAHNQQLSFFSNF